MKTVDEQNAARWIAESEARIAGFGLEIMERERISLREAADRALALPAVSHLASEVERLGGERMTVERLARLMAAAIDAPKQTEAPATMTTADTLTLVKAADEMLDAEIQPLADLFIADGMSKAQALAAALKSLPGSYAAHCAALARLSEGESLTTLRRESMARAERVRGLVSVVKSSAKAGGFAAALKSALAA